MTTLGKIDNSKIISQRVNQIESSAAIEVRQEIATGGKNVPVAKPATTLLETKKKEIDQAVKHVAGYVQNVTRELEFTVDEELNRFVVTVVDQATGAVIRQIPTEDMLRLAKTLAQAQDRAPTGILFQGKA